MNKENVKENPVLWWVGWIVLTILSFFVSCYFWTGFIAKHVGSMEKPGVPIFWVATVFGSWMALLVPLIIVMYNKVDRTYEEARNKRESEAQMKIASQLGLRASAVPVSRRLLPKGIQQKLNKLPRTLRQGQLGALKFRIGARIVNAFVWANEEIVGLYGHEDFAFDAKDVVDVELLDPAATQPVEVEKWLRFDD